MSDLMGRAHLGKPFDPRSPRRQRQVLHLHRCGPRAILECLIAVERGQPVDDVLADFARLPHSAIMLYLDEVPA